MTIGHNRPRRRERPEQTIQRAVIEHLRLRGVPGLVFWHTPNGAYLGGKRTRKGASIQGAIMKSLGVLAGVSDICALHDGRFYAVELKAPGGRSTEAQLRFRNDVNAAGGFATEAVGLDAALGCLQVWGLLRGTVTLVVYSRRRKLITRGAALPRFPYTKTRNPRYRAMAH
jgi:hypothetical protein